jgi:hypothetical protein
VAQDELAQDEQFLLAPWPPKPGDEEWTAKRDRMRRTSPDEQLGQLGLAPLRTSSSNGVSQTLQTNS